jgi:hypothetical protein
VSPSAKPITATTSLAETKANVHGAPLRTTKHSKPKKISHIGSHNKPLCKTKHCAISLAENQSKLPTASTSTKPSTMSQKNSGDAMIIDFSVKIVARIGNRGT